MAALTIERLTEFFGLYPGRRTVPVKASTKIYKGALVAIDSSGNAMPAGLLAGGTVRPVGVAAATFDNSAGAAGAIKAEVNPGIYKFNNSSAGDLITAADVGADCYIVDDNTVAKTSNTNTRAVAGKVQQVDTDGVRVLIA